MDLDLDLDLGILFTRLPFLLATTRNYSSARVRLFLIGSWTTMGSLATQLPVANNAAEAMTVNPLDELNDAAFVVEVLLSGHTEEQLEEDLIAKATALGVSIPRPPSLAEKNGDESDDTLSSSHARNTSSGSAETAIALVTSNQSSQPETRIPTQSPTRPQPGPRARSRSLNFSTYDKYLSQLEPNLCQPRFLKRTPAPTGSMPSVFSFRTRKSYISIKNGLKSRVLWRKRPCISSVTL